MNKPEENLSPGHPCRVEDIDLSKPGWEIELHFEKTTNRQTVVDMNKLQELKTFGLAEIDYSKDGRTLTLSYVKGCREKQIPQIYTAIMKRYFPRAVTSKDSDLPPTQEKPPVSMPTVPRDATGASRELVEQKGIAKTSIANLLDQFHQQTLALTSTINATTRSPPEIPTSSNEFHAQTEREEVKDPDLIIIKLPHQAGGRDQILIQSILQATDCDNYKVIRQRLKAIADEEKWLYEFKTYTDFDIIEIRKRPGLEYKKTISAANMRFIRKLPYQTLKK